MGGDAETNESDAGEKTNEDLLLVPLVERESRSR